MLSKDATGDRQVTGFDASAGTLAFVASGATRPTELFVVVEQDMYPVDFDRPLPIAIRTRAYLQSVGL